MKRAYYILIVVSAVGVMLVQGGAFIMIWGGMVAYANHLGRGMRGFGMGIALSYGFCLLMFACFVASVIVGLVRRPRIRWLWIIIFGTAWLSLNYPFLSHYPIRIPAFAATGILVLALGSGFLMSLFRKHLQSHPNLRME